MIIREVRVLSEALWESVKTDLKFFSPIQLFVKKLSEISYSEADNIDEAITYISKINDFFERYREKSGGGDLYFPPRLISLNDDSVQRIESLLASLKLLDREKLINELEKVNIQKAKKSLGGGKIFIGHGRSKLW